MHINGYCPTLLVKNKSYYECPKCSKEKNQSIKEDDKLQKENKTNKINKIQQLKEKIKKIFFIFTSFKRKNAIRN